MRQFFLLLLCSMRAFAAVPPPPGEEIASPIVKGSHVTYAGLLRQICTELKVTEDAPANATGSATVPIRSLGSTGEPEAMEGEVEVGSVHTVPLPASGSPRALISFAISGDAQWFRYLALFDVGGGPKLLDVVQAPGFPDDEGDYAKALSRLRRCRLDLRSLAQQFPAGIPDVHRRLSAREPF